MGYISDIRKKIGHDPVYMPCAAAIIYKNDKILLQHRTDNNKWAIHGGGMEFGETFLDTLKRELREELRIKPINPIFLGSYSGENLHVKYPNQDEVYVVCNVYLVNDYEGDLNVDHDEVSEVKWFGFDELPDNIHIPDIEPIQDAINYLRKR